MGWLDLLAIQGTVKSSPGLQLKSIHSSTLSFLYGPTLTSICDRWKDTIGVARHTFVGKVASVLFNMLSWSSPSNNSQATEMLWGGQLCLPYLEGVN